MNRSITRREFDTICAAAGAAFLWPKDVMAQTPGPRRYTDLPREYNIFTPTRPVKKLVQFNPSHMAEMTTSKEPRTQWLLECVATIFQGLVNAYEPRLYLHYGPDYELGPGPIDWLARYRADGHTFALEEETDFRALLERFKSSLKGYVVFDPDLPDTLNIAQTWGSLENWLVIGPDLEPVARGAGLEKQQDLRGRWTDRVDAYWWAFENLFLRCSKHVVGAQCVHFPHHPAGDTTIRDFLVRNKAFTFDLCAAFRQRREYRLLGAICAALEFPSGVWGWHCTRGHEHWAVARAARESVYTICALGMPNLSVHGGFKPKTDTLPVQKPSDRKEWVAEKGKVYIAFMMTDGDGLWAMNSLQRRNWGPLRKGTFPVSWGFLPLLADIAPAMYLHYVKTMNPHDYMVAGPTGAGYTYPHLHEKPELFLRYARHYMQRCGLEVVHITNWNDDTNWQEVDLPRFNPILFKEMDNCIGYVRGMGESAFEPHYNLADKPFVFCGEGLHRPDTDDVATMRRFIEANPNRPLFIHCLINVSIPIQRVQKIVEALTDFDVEYVRLDDFMHLIRNARQRDLISEDLYPNRAGNERILIEEAPRQWAGTKRRIAALGPVLDATTEAEALRRLNADEVGLALGQPITDEDKADVLAFALCEATFGLVKNMLNRRGIYVNRKMNAVNRFLALYGQWKGISCVRDLTALWQNWDRREIDWATTVQSGRALRRVAQQADRLFPGGKS